MIEKCEKGKHYYDRQRYKECPFCIEVEKIVREKKVALQNSDVEDTISQTVTL